MQLNLLALDGEVPLVRFYPDFLSVAEADLLLRQSLELDWQQNQIRMFNRWIPRMFNRWIPLPRLEIMFGDSADYRYLYSGSVEVEARSWDEAPFLRELRDRLEEFTGYKYQVAFGNQYRSGRDHMGYHSDDEPSLGVKPAISSVSLGATRVFKLRSRLGKEKPMSYELTHGSLVVMEPGCQEAYQHAVMKTVKDVGVRVNWTFRPYGG
ncbi:MAG: alpha-ketoglutarate-dependent dioxygenase AlkB family protein [Thainema sp.]